MPTAQTSSGPALSRLAHGSLLPLARSSDARLARRAKRGDAQALGAIFERYQQELYRFCLGLLGEPQDAQDALQNTMVKALRSLPGEKREIALRPWLYRIAHNEAIDLRRGKRETQALEGHLLDGHSSVADTAEQRERLQWALKDLGDLPGRQRAVLVMRELSGLDFADIGAALGTSGAVVRQTLYEARRNLEQMDFGRSLRCEAVTRVLSDADGRVSSRREIRAHLRDCSDCQRFRDRIEERKEALAGVAPLPVGAAAGAVQSVLGGAGGSGSGGIAAALCGSAAKPIGAAGILKAVATIAAVTAIGTTAVERGSHHAPVRDDAVATPSSSPSRVGRAAPRAPRTGAPGQVGVRAGQRPEAAPSSADAPLVTVAQRQSSQQLAQEHPSHAESPAPSDEPSPQLSPGAGSSPRATEATPQPAPESPVAEATERSEHPVRPAPSEASIESAPPPEEAPQEVEATSAPGAEEAAESPSRSPSGKAKGHEKHPSD
jgi:RNA polymerase sigma factor (sigma-70 family)